MLKERNIQPYELIIKRFGIIMDNQKTVGEKKKIRCLTYVITICYRLDPNSIVLQ